MTSLSTSVHFYLQHMLIFFLLEILSLIQGLSMEDDLEGISLTRMVSILKPLSKAVLSMPEL